MKNAETELLQLDFSMHFHTKKNEMLGDLNYYICDLRSATLLWSQKLAPQKEERNNVRECTSI